MRAATVQQYGLDGLILATFLILLAIGLLRLGTFIKYIPFPVTVGFTAGIVVIIFASQLKALLGLTLAGPEPGPLVPKPLGTLLFVHRMAQSVGVESLRSVLDEDQADRVTGAQHRYAGRAASATGSAPFRLMKVT